MFSEKTLNSGEYPLQLTQTVEAPYQLWINFQINFAQDSNCGCYVCPPSHPLKEPWRVSVQFKMAHCCLTVGTWIWVCLSKSSRQGGCSVRLMPQGGDKEPAMFELQPCVCRVEQPGVLGIWLLETFFSYNLMLSKGLQTPKWTQTYTDTAGAF